MMGPVMRMTDNNSDTALHLALRNSQCNVAEKLIELDKERLPYSVNKKGESPLYLAASRGLPKLVELLLTCSTPTIEDQKVSRLFMLQPLKGIQVN